MRVAFSVQVLRVGPVTLSSYQQFTEVPWNRKEDLQLLSNGKLNFQLPGLWAGGGGEQLNMDH